MAGTYCKIKVGPSSEGFDYEDDDEMNKLEEFETKFGSSMKLTNEVLSDVEYIIKGQAMKDSKILCM
eukprot:118725-Heterocapsa_arctica.AAC.1